MKCFTRAARRLALILAGLLAAPAAFAQLTAVGNQFWTLESPGVLGESEAYDFMGAACASGDFNGDGYADLAIGIDGDNVEYAGPMGEPMRTEAAGSVLVLYGSGNGLTSAGLQRWQRMAPENADRLGSALAAGDFNGDTFSDLAIAAPDGGPSGAGEVLVLMGSAAGLTVTGAQTWHQDSPGILGVSEQGDLFGLALAAADFDADGFADLAIGIVAEATNSIDSAGALAVLYGGPPGLSAARNQFWTSEAPVERGWFGSALATGDFNGDGVADLAVGEFGRAVEEAARSGGFSLLYGSSPNGLTAPATFAPVNAGARLGYSLAAGDFNNDGFDDLAAGAPFAEHILPGEERSVRGLAFLFLGSSVGIQTEGAKTFGIASSGPGEFGAALAVGDFNFNGFDDLAVGVPADHESMEPDAVKESGSVAIFGGNARGDLELSEDFQVWMQGADGILQTAEDFDRLGGADKNAFPYQLMARGDFNRDGLDDLAIGVPLEDFEDPDIGTLFNAGGVHVIYGSREIPEHRNDWLQELNAIRNQLSAVPVPQ